MANLPTKRRLDTVVRELDGSKRGRAFDHTLADVGAAQCLLRKGNVMTDVGATQRHPCNDNWLVDAGATPRHQCMACNRKFAKENDLLQHANAKRGNCVTMLSREQRCVLVGWKIRAARRLSYNASEKGFVPQGAMPQHAAAGGGFCGTTPSDEQQQELRSWRLCTTHPADGEQIGGGGLNSAAGELMGGEQVSALATTKHVDGPDRPGTTHSADVEQMSDEQLRHALRHHFGPIEQTQGIVVRRLRCGEAFAGEDMLRAQILVQGVKCRAALTGTDRASLDAQFCANLRAQSDALRRKADDYEAARAGWGSDNESVSGSELSGMYDTSDGD